MKLIIRRISIDVLVLFVCAAGTCLFAAPAARPTPSPSPSPWVQASPTPAPIQTLESLQSKIRGRILSPEATRSRVGVKIVSLATGKVVFENDADKYYMPASNMKNFTVATALETLGPDFRFVTSVFAAARPDSSGTLKGDLRIFGRGDVSFSTLFVTGNYYKGLDDLSDKIIAAGVKRIDGSLLADESYFSGNAIPVTWEWDDLQWSDGAEVSAFPINNNAVDLSVKGGASGAPCIVNILPTNTVFQITNTCTTGGAKRDLTVKKALDTNKVLISGTMPAGDTFTGYLAVTHPADLFIAMLKERLEKKGVVITGSARALPRSAALPSTNIELARFESPPFSIVAAKTMKPSQNMFTEVILWTLGEGGAPVADDVTLAGQTSATNARPDSATLGLRRVKNFMAKVGIPSDAVVQWDGSGLSRHDLVTPSAVVQLYTYMAKSRNAQVWRDSLAVGGIDGTLRNRFKGTAADGNFRGKTGTLDQVSALSGYVKTAAGEELIVSIIVNTLPEPPKRVALIDSIVLQLANFNGKIDQ